ncbi:Isochorismatase hydrolase [Azotobacter vinelandii CA]|uniref:Isochorismatase hydrolase n=2 Tax=Azotobacter vinelandii TaxID=354 RepID=C1DG19_AZOVD|nr:cysteine hydrolase family protein [Azotobacter vinelandii]ACO76346.1 Isochorismatase hydrolase [Azotobacter vinelandii DJ]AGK17439.1 Isochorismatase hydrolase [Azotobacter vinelandii CA]AGK19058.1 Isochorismatase hydrolase [Azotobacter vinelandii CA6]SFY24012.1 Nicotinamidase-related amidase [Azotobacter vinelandii]GLK58187.1 isochorismatase [Azotobacter vinelandii]
MSIALILIDIQNDYFPGGTMELVGADRAAEQAAKLLGTFRLRDLPVIHIQHIAARAGATFFLPGTIGAEIHESVRPKQSEPVFQKHFPNSFRETPLLDHLHGEGISQLVIAGMMTHMCVDTTIRAATDLGFSCSLAHDACATKALSFDGVQVSAEQVQISYLAALNGLFAKVISVNDLIPDIQGTLE